MVACSIFQEGRGWQFFLHKYQYLPWAIVLERSLSLLHGSSARDRCENEVHTTSRKSKNLAHLLGRLLRIITVQAPWDILGRRADCPQMGLVISSAFEWGALFIFYFSFSSASSFLGEWTLAQSSLLYRYSILKCLVFVGLLFNDPRPSAAHCWRSNIHQLPQRLWNVGSRPYDASAGL